MSNSKFISIANTIEERIDSGEYPASSKLPTHRLLASELNTTPATVAKAYKLLSDQGRLESFVGRGTFVCSHSELDIAIQAPDDEKNYNFSLLQPCLYKNLSEVKQAYQDASQTFTAALIGYTEHSGQEEHRMAAVKWAKKYGLEGGDGNNTLLTNGAQHALSLLIETLTQPNDTILVEALTYPGVLAIATLSGRNVIGVKMDQDGLCPDALDKAITEHGAKLVICIPSHQNPTGISMPLERKKAIASVVNKRKVWLAEDDIYCFLDHTTVPPIANFASEYTFHISALSKAISPAMRCGFVKSPASQVARLNAHIRSNIWLASPINFIAASKLIESGKAFQLAEVQRETARERQILARKVLNTVNCDATGFHIWLPLPHHWQPDRFTLEAKNRGVIVTSGSHFSANNTSSPHVRLSLMAIGQEARLKEGLIILQQLLESDVNTLLSY